MTDPKLPNFGIYVRIIFRCFRPHSDRTYGITLSDPFLSAQLYLAE
jgi:hypothetical protein